jgi:Tfp pilus assembly PilM family ATPase/Tfp pilus assembly protein PilN
MPGIDFKRVNPFTKKTGQDLIGIDFNNSTLKIAQLAVSLNKREFANIICRSISGLGDDDISRLIRTSLDEFKVKNPKVLNIIPLELVITKNIEIPSTEPREIREIINLQAGRHTPYSREEIVVDYIDVGTYKHSYTKILLVIVTRNVVKRHIAILEKSGIRLDKVVFAPEGVASCAHALLKPEPKDSPAIVVNLDAEATDFTIIFNNRPLFARSIPIGSRHLETERDKYQFKFVEEMRRSLEAYHSEGVEKNPLSAIWTGAIEPAAGIDALLGEALSMPCRSVFYLRNTTLGPAAIKNMAAFRQVSMLNVISAALASEELKVNLIPEEIKASKQIEEYGRGLIKTGIAVLSILVLVFFILISKIYFKNLYLEKLKERYKDVNQEAQKLENKFSKIIMIRNYLVARGYPIEVLSELHAVIPEDTQLDNIRFDEQGKISIRGTAHTMSSVFSFVDSMEKSAYIKDVKTRYTSKRKDGLKDVTDFEISASLEKQGQ